MKAIQAEVVDHTTHWMVWLPVHINPVEGCMVIQAEGPKRFLWKVEKLYPLIQQEVAESRVWSRMR